MPSLIKARGHGSIQEIILSAQAVRNLSSEAKHATDLEVVPPPKYQANVVDYQTQSFLDSNSSHQQLAKEQEKARASLGSVVLNDQHSIQESLVLRNLSRLQRDNQFLGRAIHRIPIRDAGLAKKVKDNASLELLEQQWHTPLQDHNVFQDMKRVLRQRQLISNNDTFVTK